MIFLRLARGLGGFLVVLGFKEDSVPIGFDEDVGNFPAFVGFILLLILFPVSFDLFLSGILLALVVCRFEDNLLGADFLLLIAEDLAGGGAVDGDGSADEFGEILGGKEIADIFVESAGADSE